ncbi:hypothetical protein E3T61_20960 [Cryobacterium lactosi]|uniref:WxL domain-containing protein n=1 Tax=Cryobacterium lactosi TaxID=1259202 RepID=A0A4R9BGD4_9MICO|nr:hypothetical protein [Cryobacterium lactosi]TFD83512.1 hypothetical protein E3T61_20960 [Cryobacterium lactosi]
MRTITRASIALIGAIALTGTTALSATAATDPPKDTDATVTVQGGDLTLDVPAALTLNSTGPGAPATGSLGTVTVTDATASTVGWTASITVSDFTSLVANSPVIPATAFSYTASAATPTGAGQGVVTGSGTVTGGASSTVQTATAAGNNAATWTAEVALTIPANALAGDYTGTLTHSLL